jgi:hypothetical protein
VQPGPARPGAIFIAPSASDGVTLVAVSESGKEFCAVVTADDVVRGTTDHDFSVTDPVDGRRGHPTPVACSPGRLAGSARRRRHRRTDGARLAPTGVGKG